MLVIAMRHLQQMIGAVLGVVHAFHTRRRGTQNQQGFGFIASVFCHISGMVPRRLL